MVCCSWCCCVSDSNVDVAVAVAGAAAVQLVTVGELKSILDTNLVPGTQLPGAGAKGVDPEVHGSKGEAHARVAGEGSRESRDAQAPQARGRRSAHGGRCGRRVAVKHIIILQAYIYAGAAAK